MNMDTDEEEGGGEEEEKGDEEGEKKARIKKKRIVKPGASVPVAGGAQNGGGGGAQGGAGGAGGPGGPAGGDGHIPNLELDEVEEDRLSTDQRKKAAQLVWFVAETYTLTAEDCQECTDYQKCKVQLQYASNVMQTISNILTENAVNLTIDDPAADRHTKLQNMIIQQSIDGLSSQQVEGVLFAAVDSLYGGARSNRRIEPVTTLKQLWAQVSHPLDARGVAELRSSF
jgi:hypothetical protein